MERHHVTKVALGLNRHQAVRNFPHPFRSVLRRVQPSSSPEAQNTYVRSPICGHVAWRVERT